MKRKFLLAAVITVAAITLVVATVLTTMAYLTASTAVSNTFTVGEIGIEMYESVVDTDGKRVTPIGEKKTSNGNSYHLVPATSYCKDPTIYVKPKGVTSYLFVKIRNQIKEIEDASATIHSQMISHDWKLVAETATGDIYVYAKDAVVDEIAKPVTPSANDTLAIDVFDTFTVKDDVTQAELAKFSGSKVTLNAFAIQADAFAEKDVNGEITSYGKQKSVIDAWNGVCKDISFETEFLNYDGTKDNDRNPETGSNV